MKTLRIIIGCVLAINMLVVLGGLGFLYGTDRLDRDRLDQTIDMFRLTITEQADLEAEQLATAEQADAELEQVMRLQQAENGSKSFSDYLDESQSATEIAMARYARLNREIKDLERRMAANKLVIEQEKNKLKEDRDALEADRRKYAEGNKDADFDRMIEMFEQLKPKQSKEIMQRMLSENKLNDVVDYLNAMSSRKSASIIKEFKTPEEIVQAKAILERIRTRGQLAKSS
ncbi:hypothetical protein JD969_17095 [Planctomycetota bacterium]|nr:hypothetical protein JD969_17095 [Planctomycetota bacterium]